MTMRIADPLPHRAPRTKLWLAPVLAGVLACSSPTTSANGDETGGADPQTGGAASTGGVAMTGGAGASPATGGAAPVGGGGAATGGARPTGGAPSTGGSGVGATGGTGGPGTGGASTGGAPTGGVAAGGVATGGVATGGVATGGVATGGASGGAPAAGAGGEETGGTGGGGGPLLDFCPTDEPCRIEPLGDSITEDINFAGGYRVNLFRLAHAAGHDITFVGTRSNGPDQVDGVPFPKSHEGTSGISIEGLQSQVVDAGKLTLPETSPHIILLHIGTNNMYGTHPKGAPELLAELLDAILAKCPDALLVVAQLIPLPMNTSGIDSFNAAIPGLVAERAAAGAHIVMVDQFTGFPTSELADQVHPTPTGYDQMAEVWYDEIEQYLP